MNLQFISPIRTSRKTGRDIDHSDICLQSPLRSIAMGPNRVVWSSSNFSHYGILLERHRYLPGERRSASIDRHVVSFFHNSPARLDYRVPSGEFATTIIRPGTIMISSKGPLPDVRLHMPAEFSHCALDDIFLRRVASEIGQAIATPQFHPGVQDRSMLHIFDLLTEEVQTTHPSSRLYVDSLVYALAARYLLLNGQKPSRRRSQMAGLTPRVLNRVRSKVEANLDSDLSLESLAAESGYSRAHFLRMFRAATGLTPHQYIMDLRLKRAQERLRQANSSIVDVALACGFSSQSHMTSVFRRQLDTTPGEFRRGA